MYGLMQEWLVDSFLANLIAGIIAGSLLSTFGYYFNARIKKKKDISELSALVSLVKDRSLSNTSGLCMNVPNYNLTGDWSYEVKDHNESYSHEGICKIVQHDNGMIEFKDGKRTQTTRGKKVIKHEPHVKWSSLWGQTTMDKKIRSEYLIELPERCALGYFVLDCPNESATEIKGDYHMLSPDVLFGKITFKKLKQG